MSNQFTHSMLWYDGAETAWPGMSRGRGHDFWGHDLAVNAARVEGCPAPGIIVLRRAP